jgi:hypothetical protein
VATKIVFHCITLHYLLFLILPVKKDSGNDAFFKTNKNSKMVFGRFRDDRNSTFRISVQESGSASGEQFKYFQFVLGNAIELYSLPKSIAFVYYG